MSETVEAPRRGRPPGKRAFGGSAHDFTPEEAKAAVAKRWDTVAADEGEIRQRFRKIPFDEGMQELAKLRKACELAAAELNQRANFAGEKCDICGREFDGVRLRPVQISAKRDPATGVLFNRMYCSIICVQQKNKKELGLAELIK